LDDPALKFVFLSGAAHISLMYVTPDITINDSEIEITPIRASGPGGQNVNKVASAVHMRFDIWASSLPGAVKGRLSKLSDQRITAEGVVVIKANEHRTLAANTRAAKARLKEMIKQAAHRPKRRIPTRPSLGAKRRRIESKKQRGQIKSTRRKPTLD